MNDTDADEHDARVQLGLITQDLRGVLDRHARAHPEAPKFTRWVGIYSLAGMVAQLAAEALEAEGAGAQQRLGEVVAHLALLVTPSSAQRH